MEEAVVITIVDGCGCQNEGCEYLRSVLFVGGMKNVLRLLFHGGPYFCKHRAYVGEFAWTCTRLCFGFDYSVSINITGVSVKCLLLQWSDERTVHLINDIEGCAIQATRYVWDRVRITSDARRYSEDVE